MLVGDGWYSYYSLEILLQKVQERCRNDDVAASVVQQRQMEYGEVEVMGSAPFLLFGVDHLKIVEKS